MPSPSPIAVLAFLIGFAGGWRIHQVGIAVYCLRKKALPFGYREGVVYGIGLLSIAIGVLAAAVEVPLDLLYRVSDAFLAAVVLGAAIQQLWFCRRVFSGRRL